MVRAGCVLLPAFTRPDKKTNKKTKSGPFESMRWDARVHRLDLSLYSYPKELGGGGRGGGVESEPTLTPREKSSISEAQGRVKPATLLHARQPAQHTTDWAIPAPCLSLSNTVILQRQQSFEQNADSSSRNNIGKKCKLVQRDGTLPFIALQSVE